MRIKIACPACGALVEAEQFEGDQKCSACGALFDMEHECNVNDEGCMDYAVNVTPPPVAGQGADGGAK